MAKTATAEPKETKEEPPKADRKGTYAYGLGKRKTAVAKVRLYKGNGEVTVNGRPMEDYFFGTLIGNILAPLKLTNTAKTFDVIVKISGGGVYAQSDAIRHGIARALVVYDPANRAALKKAGFMTRDARVKERKKPGLKRARRAPQWAKR